MTTANMAANSVEPQGIQDLWRETLGDPGVSIAVLDGPVDRSHPSFAGADLRHVETVASGGAGDGPAAAHGTHAASIIFGQRGGPVAGVTPRCRGLIAPIFADGPNGALLPCSQIELARAILLAIEHGAHVVNISGGEPSPSGEAHPILASAIRTCAARGVLVVAAAGNEGCDCLHVPGALPWVLPVGAMDARGEPLAFSNWGGRYRTRGILAPGADIRGARPGGGAAADSGTSYAAAIVSGVAGLLLSLQRKLGQRPDPRAVKEALVGAAVGCDSLPSKDCRRVLAGRLNVKGAVWRVMQRGTAMDESTESQEAAEVQAAALASPGEGEANAVRAAASAGLAPRAVEAAPAVSAGAALADSPAESAPEGGTVLPSHAKESGCGCGGAGESCSCKGAGQAHLVYALGHLGFSFVSEARRDSLAQHMEGNPHDPGQLLAYLEANPWDAEAVIWTLNLDATPVYAIMPQGVFAAEAYQRLREFLKEQLTEGVERISLPGVALGKTQLMTGEVVPVVRPDLRCMYNWTTAALADAVKGAESGESGKGERKRGSATPRNGVTNFLERIYHELRNLGVTSQERAINYAATNAFNVGRIFEAALKAKMELDTIEVEPSPVCRQGSDCWDVKLLFFDPENVLRSRQAYRYTVDVSDICPVTVGGVRSWSVR